MNNSDKENFARSLTALAELHNKKLSQQLFGIYWHALKQYEYKDVVNSLNRLIIDPDVGQFMPKPADIVRYIEGDTETKAIIAWGKVRQAIKQLGAWESVEFDDRRIHAVVNDMGGWIDLCRKTINELDFLSREFEKRYRAYHYQNNLEHYPSKLIGKTEQINKYQNHITSDKAKIVGLQQVNDTLKRLNIKQD